MKSLNLITALLLTTLATVGCAHYQAGDGNKLTFSTVAIAPVVNESFAPQARTYLNESLMSEFGLGGELTILPEDQAETILHVRLKNYSKNIAARSSTDSGVARSLELVLSAEVVLNDSLGNVIFARTFEIHNEVYADSGASRAESTAIPAMTKRLAEEIHIALTSNW